MVDFDFDFADVILLLTSVEQMFELEYGESKKWLLVPDENLKKMSKQAG